MAYRNFDDDPGSGHPLHFGTRSRRPQSLRSHMPPLDHWQLQIEITPCKQVYYWAWYFCKYLKRKIKHLLKLPLRCSKFKSPMLAPWLLFVLMGAVAPNLNVTTPWKKQFWSITKCSIVGFCINCIKRKLWNDNFATPNQVIYLPLPKTWWWNTDSLWFIFFFLRSTGRQKAKAKARTSKSPSSFIPREAAISEISYANCCFFVGRQQHK